MNDRPTTPCASRRVDLAGAGFLFGRLGPSLWFAAGVLAALLVCQAAGLSTLFPPLAGTAVIVFGAPRSAMARWQAVVGGHLLSAIVGIVCIRYAPVGWWTCALVAGSAGAFLLMLITDTVHSPAGANPAVIAGLASPPLSVLGALVMGLLAVLLVARLSRLQLASRTT